MEDTQPVKCGNCQWVGTVDTVGKSLFECDGLAERLDAGSEVPAGECPLCQCFAYLTSDERYTTYTLTPQQVEMVREGLSAEIDREGVKVKERMAMVRALYVMFGGEL